MTAPLVRVEYETLARAAGSLYAMEQSPHAWPRNATVQELIGRACRDMVTAAPADLQDFAYPGEWGKRLGVDAVRYLAVWLDGYADMLELRRRAERRDLALALASAVTEITRTGEA